MKLGGPVFREFSDPDAWIAALRDYGYGAAYCPVNTDADDTVVKAYAEAAKSAGIVIAEVGAWSNPIDSNEEARRKAQAHCRAQLALADRIGARCCVNVSGSRGQPWYGPHPDNFSEETFDMVVQVVRGIIDDVDPTRTFYTLETMPWMYPDSADCYLRLVEAIDRRQFAVHFDPSNLLSSPQRFYGSGEVIREFVAKLGPRIRSCHAKDLQLGGDLMPHFDEVRPGLGGLDYATLLRELSKLDPDTPLMMEHLATEEEYAQAAAYIRSVAEQLGIGC